jgi:hypothetical protein
MNDYLYLSTMVADRRSARMATAERRRLFAGLRASRASRRPTLTLAASAVRTTADVATPRAA